MPTFVLLRDDKVVGAYPIKKKVISIGRSRDNTISIANGTISRHHVRLELGDDGTYILTDLGSLNGTYLNEKRVNRAAVKDGDRISIGVYVVTYSTKGAPPLDGPGPRDAGMLSCASDPSTGRAGSAIKPELPPTTISEAPAPSLRAQPKTPIHLEVIPADAALGIALIRVCGVIDHTNFHDFESFLGSLYVDAPPHLIFDLADLVSTNSATWGLLAKAHKDARERGRLLKLAQMRPAVRDTFDLLSLDRIFDVRPTVDDALAAVRAEVTGSAPQEPPPETKRVRVEVVEYTPPPQSVPDPRPGKAPAPPELSLEEKIRAVIRENPLATENQIQQRLRDDAYGEKVGRLKLRSVLKSLNLDTRLRRYQFFMHS